MEVIVTDTLHFGRSPAWQAVSSTLTDVFQYGAYSNRSKLPGTFYVLFHKGIHHWLWYSAQCLCCSIVQRWHLFFFNTGRCISEPQNLIESNRPAGATVKVMWSQNFLFWCHFLCWQEKSFFFIIIKKWDWTGCMTILHNYLHKMKFDLTLVRKVYKAIYVRALHVSSCHVSATNTRKKNMRTWFSHCTCRNFSDGVKDKNTPDFSSLTDCFACQ